MRVVFMLLAIFLLAGLVRAGVWWQLRDDGQFNQFVGDPVKYDAWARDIAAGDWLSRREGVFYQAPLYPYFLAMHYAIFGDGAVHAVRTTQLLLGSLAAVMLAAAAGRMAGIVAGGIAGILLALQPSAVFFDVQIEKACLDGFLMAALLLIVTMTDRPRWPLCLLAGVVLGVMSLSRENAMALLAVLLPLAWLAGRRVEKTPDLRRQLLPPALTLLAFVAVMAPVAVRNRAVGGEWHLSTSQFGPNFYIGNHAGADGVYRPLRPGRGDARFERDDATQLAELAEGRSLSPRGVSRHWTRRTLTDIADDPARWLNRLVRKWMLLFHAAEIADNNDLDSAVVASPILRASYFMLNFGVITALAGAGVVASWLARGTLRGLMPILAILAVMSASAALFFVFARYRFPLLHPLILVGASGLAALRPGRRDRTDPTDRPDAFAVGATLAAAAVLLFLFTAAQLLPLRVRGAGTYNRALAHERRGDVASAETLYRKAIAINPLLVEARNNLGLLLASRGQFDPAIEQYRAVLLHHPNDAFAHNNLGMALGAKGDLPRAVEHFERALQLDPSLQQARQNLEQARRMMRP